MPKIDVARLNAHRPQPKPSANPPEITSTRSDDAAWLMEVDKVPMGRTLRKRKEKVAKHLKRAANEKEMESFQKRVFRIPLEICESLLFSNLFQIDCLYGLLEDKQKGKSGGVDRPWI